MAICAFPIQNPPIVVAGMVYIMTRIIPGWHIVPGDFSRLPVVIDTYSGYCRIPTGLDLSVSFAHKPPEANCRGGVQLVQL